jgi:hypothetical protein
MPAPMPAASPLLTKSLPPPPPQPNKLCIALVSKGRPEAMLPLAVSMLNLQTKLVTTDIQTELHIVDSFDEALGVAHKQGSHVLAVDTNIGFAPEFVTRALASPHQVVSAVYPLPGVNWERVKASPVPAEPVAFKGNTYNAVPAPCAAAAVDGYVETKAPLLGCMLVKAGVVEDILRRHPDCKHASGARLAHETVVDGAPLLPHETFARLWGKPMHADVDCPATLTAPMSYAGSVAMRHFLR